MNFHPEEFLDLGKCEHPEIFDRITLVWDVIKRIGSFLADKISHFKVKGEIMPGAHVIGPLHLGNGSIIEPGAVIKGPCWIGEGVAVRAGAYLRENVIIGSHSVVGNSCELKNCILFEACEVPHFNYVGDSVLGYKAHLGAGVILSNVRLDRKEVFVSYAEKKIPTGMKKFGAVVGDYSEVGCNCVLNPGSILGRRCVISPLVNWKGCLDKSSIVKNSNDAITIIPAKTTD
jgi:NDP-sugar pyrophosphorylase family protein